MKPESHRGSSSAGLSLEERESLLGDLLDHIPGMIYRTTGDSDQEFEYVSAGCLELTGKPSQYWCSHPPKHFESLIHPDDRRMRRMVLSSARRTRQNFEVVYRLHVDLGERRWVLDRGRVLFDPHGIISQIEGQLTDATQTKEIEESLRSSEERYRQLLEIAPIAVVINQDGYIRFANKAASELMGLSSVDDLLNREAIEFIHPDYHRIVLERAAKVLSEGTTMPAIPYKLIRPDGEIVEAESTAGPVTLHGKPAIQIAIRDVTYRSELEDRLRHSQKMEAVGRLAGGVAHDFNNLLTAINGYSELTLLALGPDHPQTEDVREILKAGERGSALVSQLLAFSRKQVLDPRVIDLNQRVSQLERMLKRVIGEDVQLVSRLAPGLSHIQADPGQIEQVILNLAINARDAMPQGGTLTLQSRDVDLSSVGVHSPHASMPDRHVELSIADDGCGMDGPTLARIFEPFFTTKEAGKGTGLGLATVYGIVNQSGGVIQVDSNPGHGTTFRVYLPAVEDEPEIGNKPADADLNGSETILLVEDDPMVRDLTHRILSRYGYKVLVATSGEDALDLARQSGDSIDLLMTDVVMPRMGGRELADLLIRRHPSISVLYISGYTEDAIVNHGVQESGTSLLQKPFTARALAEKVRAVLNPPMDENHSDGGS